VMQGFVGRHRDVQDLVADGIGVALAVGVFFLARLVLRR
jgi:VanZ family protein